MLVVQSNPFNESRISTVVVAAISSNLALAAAPGNVRIGRADSGLAKHSVINTSQVLTVDRSYLTQRVRALPGQIQSRVDAGLRLVLGL